MSVLKSRKYGLLHLDNVVGVGIGNKEVRGNSTGETSVTVLVKKKLPSSNVPVAHCIPKQINRVATDVIEVGEIMLLDRTEKVRPAVPGSSIGHPKVTAGTFGAVVRDRKTGKPLILSNNHVLANITDGRDGRARVGDPILQPGRYDGGQAEDVVAYLERFVPICRVSSRATCPLALAAEGVANMMLRAVQPSYEMQFVRKSSRENLVDAAVARPVSEDMIKADIMEVGAVSAYRDVEIGMKVKKSGRTTGLTTGVVKVISTTLKISLGEVGEAYFVDQIVTSAMGQPGDSGSLVVTEDGAAVGLLGAGSDRATICSRITNVMELLDIVI
ncbi:MAG: hypothetical protein HPY55_10730 [Firmicutes bacterium]|nr:hypothetical protein [Bacillota bacterium]